MNLSFNSTLQLINDISSNLKELFRYFNGKAIVVFPIIPFAPPASVLPNNSSFHLKNLKSLVFSISSLKSVVSPLN